MQVHYVGMDIADGSTQLCKGGWVCLRVTPIDTPIGPPHTDV
jgi:hypothetical protein